ncbi:ATP-binding protein [Pseudomonas sp. 5P_3.1_Bac2]|uniref:ATP-binding protein n=1 Tax=Pseudomonas sp. 5P_3.1_Bac2 TaxID=2971617 RepID=UPI0021C61FA3|nr:ATP-binding protein [Pseudomonas sp. 5P_3.1_Bac2]MCU1718852.1 ATP-binding protein [Pseudomonas sp. 5P_3.1_Bac2]
MPLASSFPLRRWIWRAFAQSALIPLILVESVLIAAYLWSNTAIRDAQVEHLQQGALDSLSAAVKREGQVIDVGLRSVESQVKLFRDATLTALNNSAFEPDAIEIKRHTTTPSGVFYSRTDDGRAASFYANSTPLAQQDHAKALRLSQLDPLMRSISEVNPRVASSYFNTFDSYNRIYPFFRPQKQYPHDMVIPDYNFYYLADAKHNPQRNVAWTEVYVDPAGMGWMVSAVAPVYRGDFLEGVVGLDITVGQILNDIGELDVPWQGYAVLVGRDNRILALPRAGEEDFGLNELTGYSYAEAVRREILKPEDFKLSKHREMQPVLRAMEEGRDNVQEVLLGGRKQLVAWSEIPQTGWKLLLVVDEQNIFHETNRLANHYQKIGYWLIAGLLLFYLLFFAWMWLRSRRLSEQLVQPIDGIVGMMCGLGRGEFQPNAPVTPIKELAHMADAVLHTGEQLQASEAQRLEAQRILDVVLQSTTESLWTIDIEAETITLSQRFIERFGLAASTLPLREYNQRMHPNDQQRISQLRGLFAYSGEDQFEAEYRFADANGEYVWLLSRGRVLERDSEGHLVNIAGTYVDISRLKRVQDELRRATQDAQAASQAKSRFLSSMSHELRTPLNAIYGFGQLIEMEVQGRPEAKAEADYAREIINASRHLTSLVDEILDLSSIENSRQQINLQPVAVADMLRSCGELIQPQVQQRQLQLEVLAEPDVGLYVQADLRRLRQVLLNLLSNAIKYNVANGMVRVGYEVRPDCVRLWVEDSGTGLSREQQGNLFQPFQRLGRENSSIPGTGIGLVLSRELAHLMGGEIGFTSTVGLGSRFWIDLPSAAAPAGADETQPNAPALQPKVLANVLCVEDHPASLKLVQEALRDIANVRGVGSLQLALAELEHYTPTLVLLDLDLPDGDGLQVLDMMRSTARLQTVPVLVISAAADKTLFEQACARGAQACLAKPINLAQIRSQAIHLLSHAL